MAGVLTAAAFSSLYIAGGGELSSSATIGGTRAVCSSVYIIMGALLGVGMMRGWGTSTELSSLSLGGLSGLSQASG